MQLESTKSSLLSREDHPYIIYYVALSLITVLLTHPDSKVGEFYRILYSFAIFIPPILKGKWLPFSLNVFVSVSICSFSPLLPSKTILIVIAALAVGLLSKRIVLSGVKSIIWIFLIYIFLIALLYSDIQELMAYSVLMTLICIGSIGNKDEVSLFALSFVFVAIILSLMFLLNFETFLVQYAKEEALDRSGWINPNMFGGHLSLGIVAAYWLFRSKTANKIWTIILLLSVGVSLLVLIMNASRGALMASVLPIGIMVLFSKMKVGYKIVSLGLGALLVLYAFNNGFFDLLIYRLQDETVRTGGDRFTIWLEKLDAFNQNGILSVVFGVGQTNCELLGATGSTHNDFVTALLSYGIVGFVLFAIVIFNPLFSTFHHFSIETIAFFTVMLVESLVLEPFFRGYLIYYMFFLFILKYNKHYVLQR